MRLFTKEEKKKLFEDQVQCLVKLGFREDINEKLGIGAFDRYMEKLRDVATSEYEEVILSDNYLPFLIIIPEKLVPLSEQIGKIVRSIRLWIGDEVIEVYRDFPSVYRPEKIVDYVDTPKHPYLLFNVENGSETEGLSIAEAVQAIERKGRRPLTVTEGIALYLQKPEVINYFRALGLLGSRYILDDPEECIPVLKMYDIGKDAPHVEISPKRIDYKGNVLVPSCSNKIGDC